MNPAQLPPVSGLMVELNASSCADLAPQVTLEMQCQVNPPCHSLKPATRKHLGRAFISLNALLTEHPSCPMSGGEGLRDCRQRPRCRVSLYG